MRRLPFPASRAGRALLAFWAVLLLAAILGAAVLQWLGPPHPRRLAASGPTATKPTATKPTLMPPSAALPPSTPPATKPHPAEAVQAASKPTAASKALASGGAKRIAILLDGLGLSEADSLEAIERLPAPVSLAVSPYAIAPSAILSAARKAGHEILLSLPMEPAGAPLDDEGTRALTDQVTPEENQERLQWALSRINSYVGVTNAFVGLRGERFAESIQFNAIARLLAKRGLFYLDATPDQPPSPGMASADADLRLDDPPGAAAIDRQLTRLERIAQIRGTAIGVAGPIYPVTIARLADWARTLPEKGLELVPVSSLVTPPHPPPTNRVSHGPG